MISPTTSAETQPKSSGRISPSVSETETAPEVRDEPPVIASRSASFHCSENTGDVPAEVRSMSKNSERSSTPPTDDHLLSYSHPEISADIRPESKLPTLMSTTTSGPDTFVSDVPATFSHPEIAKEIHSEPTLSKVRSAILSHPEISKEIQPDHTLSRVRSAIFSHPEISQEYHPGHIALSKARSAIFPLPEISLGIHPEHTLSKARSATFSHPEISREIKPGNTPSEVNLALALLATAPTEGLLEKPPGDSSPVVFSHPEILEELRVEEPLSTPTSGDIVETEPENPAGQPVVFQEVLRQATRRSSAVCETGKPLESAREQRREVMVVDDISPTFAHLRPLERVSESQGFAAAAQPKSIASLTPFDDPKKPAEEKSEEKMPSGSAVLKTVPTQRDHVTVHSPSETPFADALATSLPGQLLEPEEDDHLKALPSKIIPRAYFSEELPGARTKISKDDRRAILNALTRKTVSQDAVFEPVLQGERKYVSQTSARKTITDHSKDFDAITSAEREALVDIASRKILLPTDSSTSTSPFQADDVPVWYTNPISGEANLSRAGKTVTLGQRQASDEMQSTALAPSKIFEEAGLTSKFTPSVSASTLGAEASSEPGSSVAEERKEVDEVDQRTRSQDRDLEPLPETQQYDSKPAWKGVSGHVKEVIDSPLDSNLPPELPSFSIEPPLMPFSKKERRELVRSISMQIKDPEVPLWDMDLMDIKEAEEAELQKMEKKNRQASPLPVEPGFGLYEPMKPKVLSSLQIERISQSTVFCSNKIKTTKYTLMTFLPTNLFLQSLRFANLYFILIASLQLIPDFSPTNWGTTVAPLVFVLLLNAIKEGIDEFKRSVSDRIVNKQKVEVLNENHFYVTKWRSVIVGDIVRVKSDQEFPADLVFLSSSDAKGLAYIETANLDGETTLKVRNAFYKGSSTGEDDETPLSIFSGLMIECELPNNRLYKFEGAINLQDYGKLPLDTRQVLLRGGTLRNTEWILGVVVYTGPDTKFLRNMIPGQVKITCLERAINLLVAIVFVCQVALCAGLAAANDNWTRNPNNIRYFIPDFDEILQNIGPKPNTIAAQFGRFLILLNQLIPISLYVTLEIVKVVQSYYIDWDVHMYHISSQTHAKARTTNLNEELGQVQYVMADKTGTLTQNMMAFVQCSIGGVIYGTVQHEGGSSSQAGALKKTIHSLCNDPKLIQKLKDVAEGSQDLDSEFLRAFFYHLAICHVVHPMLAKKGEGGYEEDTVLKYTGASPDEEALVQGAADCGYSLKKRAQDELLVYDPEQGGTQKFVIMAVLEFTSERKRMSIICRDFKGRIKLYCKGADSVIFKRLAPGQEELMDTSLNQLEDFARCGYRTICMAEREISAIEYEQWAARFRAASIALDDRDEKLAAVSETIERDMLLLGVTAVEDKLQGKVPETITLLAQAGIKVWVLTGDKLETSVSVALSCNLLADSMHLFLLSDNVVKSVPQLIRSMLEEARRQHRTKLQTEGSDYHSEMAAVIEGSSLAVALEEGNKLLLLELLMLCRSVVCCRVSPIQKAQVTMLLKDHGNSVVLAIGDGANDCGMIKVAQIGVGIGGREGMAAVLASDYSLTRFRYLRRLLLVHGRWSYKRNRELAMFAFYKNIVYALGNAYLSFYSGYSSQALYNAVEIATYNLIWTSLLIIACAIFDKDLSDCTAENNPQLYMETQSERRGEFFWCMFGWTLAAIWDSLIVFFFPLAGGSLAEKDGGSMSLWEMGSVVYTMAVFIVNVKIITRMHNLTWFHFAALQVSTSLWLLVFFCFSYTSELNGFFPDLEGIGLVVTQRPSFWLLLILCPVAALLPYFTFKTFRTLQAPEDFEIMREIEHGWTDGHYFPDARDYVEQITAPTPERRISLEFPEDEHGPSPLQKEIADARQAVLAKRGGLSKIPEMEGVKDFHEGEATTGLGTGTGVGTDSGAPPLLALSQGKQADGTMLRPRRLTWRQVVNEDELEDLTSSDSLGRDGRRRSNGFQVVTRHGDTPEPPVPIVHGPSPPQRKSVLFRDDEGAPASIVAARRASLIMRAQAGGLQSLPHPKVHKKQHQVVRPEDSRLKAVRANLAKHAEERRTLVSGPGGGGPASAAGGTGTGSGTGSGTTKKTKKRQKLWDAVKEGSAEPEPADHGHPLQRMRPPKSTTTSGSRGSGGSRSSTKASPHTAGGPSGTYNPPGRSRFGAAPRFDPSTSASREHSRIPSSPPNHHHQHSGARQGPMLEHSTSADLVRPPPAPGPDPQSVEREQPRGQRTPPSRSRLSK